MITAKFKVSRIAPWSVTAINEDGSIEVTSPEQHAGEVELTPDYAQGRNAEWAKATPSGVIRMTISNPSALAQFRLGRAFTVIFEPEDE